MSLTEHLTNAERSLRYASEAASLTATQWCLNDALGSLEKALALAEVDVWPIVVAAINCSIDELQEDDHEVEIVRSMVELLGKTAQLHEEIRS